MPDPLPIVDDRRVRRPNATEDDVLVLVRQAAALGGWLCYHTHDSRRSPEGFPDIVAVHPQLGRMVFAELKSAKGKVTPDQEQWLAALQTTTTVTGDRRVHPAIYLWRPADVDAILQVFLGHRLSATQPDRDSSLARDTTAPREAD